MKRLLLLLLLPISLLAQTTGQVTGVALDSLGNTVGGATITVCALGSSGIPCAPVTASTTSNGQGAFSVTVPVGTYTVTVFRLGVVATSSTVVVAPSNITVPNNIVGGTASFTNLTATGTNTLSTMNTIQYLGGPTPQLGGSADIGAQLNSAYTSALSTGGNAGLFPQTGGGCYTSTTPITFTTSGKYFSVGGTYTGNQTGGVNQGICINYTPTTATSALTIDWTPATGGGYSPGAGLRDFQLTGACGITAGGCANSAVGLNIGPSNGGAHKALFLNLKQSGFGLAGRQINDTVGWGITDLNSTFAYNTTGLKYITASHENDTCMGCAFAVNGTGVDMGTGSNNELSVISGSTDGNTVKGFNNGGGFLSYVAHHFENPGCSSDLYGTMNGPTNIFGATVLEDCAAAGGPTAQLFTMTGNFLNAQGLNVFSGGRVVTNLVNNSAGGNAFISYTTSTPTLIAPGVNNSDATKTCAIAYNCIVVRITGNTPQFTAPVWAIPFAGGGDPSCASLGGISNLIWNKASTNRVTMCNNGGAADNVIGAASTDTLTNKSFGAGGIVPAAAGGTDLGSTALPFLNLWLGTAAANNFKFAPASTAAARVISIPDPLAATALGLSYNATNPVYQSKRGVAGCTTAASIGGTCASDITVTWGTAFGDVNYSVTCTGSTPTAVPAAPFVVSGTKLAATVHINYFAITAVAASYATIDCIAVHD